MPEVPLIIVEHGARTLDLIACVACGLLVLAVLFCVLLIRVRGLQKEVNALKARLRVLEDEGEGPAEERSSPTSFRPD